MSESSKTKGQFNGHQSTRAEEDAVRMKVAEAPGLHSGARLAAKLKATIIVNGTEFNHAGEMSVDDRHLYHEALEALFPSHIAVVTTEEPEVNEPKRRSSYVWLVVLAVGGFGGVAYLCLHHFFT